MIQLSETTERLEMNVKEITDKAADWAAENVTGGTLMHHRTILEQGAGWQYHGEASDKALLAVLRNKLTERGMYAEKTDGFGRVWYRSRG